MKQYYIYMTTNNITNHKYIGQHYGELQDNYLGSGVVLSKAIKKYGKENFSKTILKICANRDEANKQEALFIQRYNAVENDEFYNIAAGGYQNDEIAKLANQYWETHPEHAKIQRQQRIARLRQWEKDNPERHRKEVITPFVEGAKRFWNEHPDYKKECMQKLNKAKIKWQLEHPEEHQKQVDEWRQKGTEANSKPVICITTGEIFPSQSEAARYYNIPQGNISKCLKGERQSAGKLPNTKQKLFWKFYEKPIDKTIKV